MVKAICNNPDCKYAHSRKVFEVDDLSAPCPSCETSNLLPETASKYIDTDKHKKDNRIKEMKTKIEKSHGHKIEDKTNVSKRKKSLKNIEMSYRKKMNDLEKALKSNKLSRKFKEIDSDISDGDLELKDIKYELEKIDSLFNKFNSSKKTSKTTRTKKKTKKKATKVAGKKSPTKEKKIDSKN